MPGDNNGREVAWLGFISGGGDSSQYSVENKHLLKEDQSIKLWSKQYLFFREHFYHVKTPNTLLDPAEIIHQGKWELVFSKAILSVIHHKVGIN